MGQHAQARRPVKPGAARVRAWHDGLRLLLWHAIAAALLFLAFAGQARAATRVNADPIEGYVNPINVLVGASPSFYVSECPGGWYTVTFYRWGLNDPNGNNPTTIAAPVTLKGTCQKYDSLAAQNGANWQSSFTTSSLRIDTHTWPSGIYSAKLTARSNVFYITFVVEDPIGSQQAIGLVASTNTWEAYNFWPADSYGQDSHGNDLFDPGGFYPTTARGCGVPYVNTVSFLRPNPYASPRDADNYNCTYPPFDRTDHLAAGEIKVAAWLEKEGYSYSMTSDASIDQNPSLSQLNGFKTVIISTHSEYWTRHMYDVLTAYERAGGNVIDLSGNTAYRQVETCWSGCTHLQSMSKAPPVGSSGTGRLWSASQQADVFGVDSWQAAGASVTNGHCQPYSVVQANHFLLTGVPVTSGTIGTATDFPRGLTACHTETPTAGGWEVDKSHPILADEYDDLARASFPGTHPSYSDIIYMRPASGGQVFSAGSILFGQSLLADSNGAAASQSLTPLLKNVLARFGATPRLRSGESGRWSLL